MRRTSLEDQIHDAIDPVVSDDRQAANEPPLVWGLWTRDSFRFGIEVVMLLGIVSLIAVFMLSLAHWAASIDHQRRLEQSCVESGQPIEACRRRAQDYR